MGTRGRGAATTCTGGSWGHACHAAPGDKRRRDRGASSTKRQWPLWPWDCTAPRVCWSRRIGVPDGCTHNRRATSPFTQATVRNDAPARGQWRLATSRRGSSATQCLEWASATYFHRPCCPRPQVCCVVVLRLRRAFTLCGSDCNTGRRWSVRGRWPGTMGLPHSTRQD